MVRLLDASITLNNWAVALNIFALWAASASVAGLVFALSARQSKRPIAASLEPDGSLRFNPSDYTVMQRTMLQGIGKGAE